MIVVRGLTTRLFKCAQPKLFNIPLTFSRVTPLPVFRRIDDLQGVFGAELGSDPDFHDIPTNPLNATNSVETPNKIRSELFLLLRVLQEDGKLCQ